MSVGVFELGERVGFIFVLKASAQNIGASWIRLNMAQMYVGLADCTPDT